MMLFFLATGLANWICSFIQVFILLGVLLGVRGGHLLVPLRASPLVLIMSLWIIKLNV
jgi:hypothetical protein